MPKDPRYFQIAILLSLLLYASFEIGVRYELLIVLSVFSCGFFVQAFASRSVGIPKIDQRSTCISCLSLLLLLKSSSVLVFLFAITAAIASKFVLRAANRHIFNPTNFGIALALLLFEDAWISTGQWGREAFVLSFLAFLGFVVVFRSERSDISFAFLLSYGALIFGRALYLGDPLSIAWHQLGEGALLIFAFLMISDPKTTPDSRSARVFFAALVASLAVYIRFSFYEPAALIYALIVLSPLVPLLNRFLKSERYEWGGNNKVPLPAVAPLSKV